MNVDKRAEHTIKVWSTLMVGLVFSMLFTADKLGIWSLGLAALIVGAGITTTGFMWNWGDYARYSPDVEADAEKAKRTRLSSALRELSDSELSSLRQRLANGDIDDEKLARLLEESELEKVKRY